MLELCDVLYIVWMVWIWIEEERNQKGFPIYCDRARLFWGRFSSDTTGRTRTAVRRLATAPYSVCGEAYKISKPKVDEAHQQVGCQDVSWCWWGGLNMTFPLNSSQVVDFAWICTSGARWRSVFRLLWVVSGLFAYTFIYCYTICNKYDIHIIRTYMISYKIYIKILYFYILHIEWSAGTSFPMLLHWLRWRIWDKKTSFSNIWSSWLGRSAIVF